MVTQFFTQQLDYIFFFYGLAFILLMAVCAIIHKREEATGLPWILLGIFGLIHGVNEWFDLLAISLGDSRDFASLRLLVMLLSFVFLMEFGRRGLRSREGKGPGAWIYLPLLLFVVLCGRAGMPEFNAAVRYAFGLVGGLMAAGAIWRAARVDASDRLLTAVAVIVALYAVASGLVVPKASFFPATWLNHPAFLSATGIPIQLLRGLLAVACTAVIWRYHQNTKFLLALNEAETAQERTGKLLTAIIICLLTVGWVGTQLFGREAMRQVRSNILQLTRTTAAAISTERVERLSVTPADLVNPDYIRLRSQLTTLHEVNLNVHLIRLMFLKNGEVHIAVDSAGERDNDHKEIGTYYRNPPHELLAVFASGDSRTVGPYKDEDGTFVSGFSPLSSPGGKTVAVIGVDFTAASWQQMEAKYRLMAIATTLLFATLIAGFFIVIQRMLESTHLLGISRRRLEESQLQRQHELEEMNQQLEERVTQRTAKLVASNRELQHFAYIASHDLQEPLRTITSFVQLLAKRYQGKLDKDADEFIGFITDGAQRMKTLINDLLAYSRVGSSAKPFAGFEGESALERTLANLRQSIEKNGAVITRDHLPTLLGDETQIVQLFQNLLGNAIKFHGDRPPEIHVGFADRPGEWEISVRDNGIGMKPEFYDRIFVIFQRLHTIDRYDGTGIGLSICKKIVERHGGRIAVESEEGVGTIFTFTISKTPRPVDEDVH